MEGDQSHAATAALQLFFLLCVCMVLLAPSSASHAGQGLLPRGSSCMLRLLAVAVGCCCWMRMARRGGCRCLVGGRCQRTRWDDTSLCLNSFGSKKSNDSFLDTSEGNLLYYVGIVPIHLYPIRFSQMNEQERMIHTANGTKPIEKDTFAFEKIRY